MVVGRRGQRQTEPEPDVFGLICGSTEEHLWRGHVREALEEVVLSQPDVVEAVFVGVDNLIDGLPDDPRLGVSLARRDEHLVEYPELHCAPIDLFG